MFHSLNSRLLFSYIIIILVCLVLVGLGLLLFVRASPLWSRASSQRLEQAEQSTLRTLWQEERSQSLTQDRFHDLLIQAAEENEVRIFLLDSAGRVSFDTAETWVGSDFSEDIRLRVPGPPRLQGLLTTPNGEHWLFVGSMLRGAGSQRQALIFTSPPNRLFLLFWFANNLLPPLLQAGTVALVLSVMLAFLISRSVAAPLRKVADAAESIARGESDTRASVSGPIEVRGLAHSFNTMADQVESTQRSQRDFVTNVSHELKTPLTSIQGFSQALLDGTASTSEAITRAARIIYEEAARMSRMVDKLLLLVRFDARQAATTCDSVELRSLLRGCVEKLAPQAQAADVTLNLDTSQKLFVTGDGDQLAQVFANLLDNGIAYTPAGGEVTLAARPVEGQAVEVTVADTGAGIPAEALPRIFERFYQVDESRGRRRGAGLGLAISKEIIEAHSGAITVESVLGQGSKFTVQLPLASTE